MKRRSPPIFAEKDRNAVSLEFMNRMKFYGMAAAFTESLSLTFAEAATSDSFLNWLFSCELYYCSEAVIQRLIQLASFRYKFYPKILSAGGDYSQMERLASLEFVRQAQNLFVTGSSGTRKSVLTTALGYQACKSVIRTFYVSASKLLKFLKMAKAKGTIETELRKIERCPLLILDDLSLVPLDVKECSILWTS